MPAVEFRNPVALLQTFLLARVKVPVVVNVPESRPARFVLVDRLGGGAINRVLDEPLLMVQAWAGSKSDAFDLADDCRRPLLHDWTQMPLVRSVQEESFYSDPSPDGVPRVTLTVRMRVRATRTQPPPAGIPEGE